LDRPGLHAVIFWAIHLSHFHTSFQSFNHYITYLCHTRTRHQHVLLTKDTYVCLWVEAATLWLRAKTDKRGTLWLRVFEAKFCATPIHSLSVRICVSLWIDHRQHLKLLSNFWIRSTFVVLSTFCASAW
jgi:hypothetical protein